MKKYVWTCWNPMFYLKIFFLRKSYVLVWKYFHWKVIQSLTNRQIITMLTCKIEYMNTFGYILVPISTSRCIMRVPWVHDEYIMSTSKVHDLYIMSTSLMKTCWFIVIESWFFCGLKMPVGIKKVFWLWKTTLICYHVYMLLTKLKNNIWWKLRIIFLKGKVLFFKYNFSYRWNKNEKIFKELG